MTATTAELCGHRWQTRWKCYAHGRKFLAHECVETTTHPPTTPCRCRCGATTTRKDTQ